jgi:tRNA (guanine37-N1)-methyltransferase
MMRFDIITIFPHAFHSYLATSILGRAIRKKRIDVRVHDLRAYSTDRKHKKVDDRPYGGGPGMVMSVVPFHRALKKIVPKQTKATRVVLLAAKGRPFTQKVARDLATNAKRIVLFCGRYEGVDERVRTFADEEYSIGPYVLTGGELPALMIIDAVSRLLPGVLGKDASSKDESWSDGRTVEYPQYTRPEAYKKKRVPRILLSGDHQRIEAWRKQHRTPRTPIR